jgi:histone-lysine N-methyltransferase SETD1
MPKVTNVFQDERRKKMPQKPRVVRGLHRQMLDFYDDEKDSDDEGRSSFTRDTDEQESRPLSRAASSDIEDEEPSSRANRAKRRRLDAGWGEESDDEMMDDSHARSLLAHLIDKDPEYMAEKELEQVLAILPRSSPIWKKADRALKGARKLRRTLEDADALFFGINHDTSDPNDGVPRVDVTMEDEDPSKPLESTELQEVLPKKPRPKSKKKTKKQIFEERELLKAEAKAASEETQPAEAEEETPAAEDSKPEVELFERAVDGQRAEVEWGVSADKPRRTVEDDLSVVLDIDGWQHVLKDNEDLKFLRQALEAEPESNLGDVHLWAWKQKQIKTLNRQGQKGIVRNETQIEGYFVPNSTGSARTEGVKKILESEKSKYLPHRIRVQKAREEREARQSNDLTPAADTAAAAKLAAVAKIASTASSRSNRANNRRLVNDINIQKQMSAEGDAMRFNQLKKRKKLVKFDRSAIHNWGLYAEENIAINDMIIEYVGEKVRQRVADLREKKYDLQGVGSSYLFRIDEDTVIDATKMGGIARFINHSCTPNCTAKIIRVDGTKRIVIYALRDIAKSKLIVSPFLRLHPWF